MNKTKSFKYGMMWGTINNILTIIFPFVIRTIIIYTLGNEYLGLGGLFSSIIQVLSLTELGFGGAITFALFKPIAEGDSNKVNSILNFFRKIYRIVGFAVLAISLIIMVFLDKLVKGHIPNDINLYLLFAIYIVNTVSSYFLFAYKKVLFSAEQRYDLEAKISAIILCIQSVAQIIVLLIIKNYYIYILMLPIGTILNNIVSEKKLKKMHPEYLPKGSITDSEVTEIVKNVKGAFFSKVGSTVYLSVDNLVISAFLGLEILGKYGNYYYIITALIAFFAVIHNTIRPIIGNSLIVESKEQNWKQFKIVIFCYMWLTVICCSYCAALYQNFESLWAGYNNLLPNGMVIFLVIYFFTTKMFGILTVYQEAAGVWWYGRYIAIIGAAVNLVLNIILVQIIGLYGILISSIISGVFIIFPGTMHIIFKYVFPIKEYRKEYVLMIISFVVKMIILVIISLLVADIIYIQGIFGLVIKFVVVTVLNCMFYFISSITSKEGRVVNKFIKSKLIKTNKNKN